MYRQQNYSGNYSQEIKYFGSDYLAQIKGKELEKKLSLESFEYMKEDLKKFEGNSALRKVYDSYLKILEKKDFEVEKEIWFAKIAYQEKRKSAGKTILPNGFNKFLREIYKDLDYNKDNFAKFLEVFVAYHKYFNPNAK